MEKVTKEVNSSRILGCPSTMMRQPGSESWSEASAV